MPKKTPRTFGDDILEDLFIDEPFDEDAPDEFEIYLDAQDIVDLCGRANSNKGRTLFQQQRVTDRAFDGNVLSATVRDDISSWHPTFDIETDEGVCQCPAEQNLQDNHCEHIAALLHAYVSDPESFNPQSLGEIINLVESNPALQAEMTAQNPEFAQFMHLLTNASPELRALIQRLGPDTTPEDLMQLRSAVESARVADLEKQLLDLLDGLTQNQLRAIAQRRGWNISQNKKEMVVQLTQQLRAAPVPPSFTPEEEQLLRLENTLYGLEDMPTPQTLNDMWKRRAGGDMARLDKARRGLESAGLLFECRRESGRMHYHWSPLLASDALPLFRPKIVSLVSMPQPDWQIESNPALMSSQLDALLDLVSQTPLHTQAPALDPALSKHPYIMDWQYELTEAQKLTQPRSTSVDISQGMRVPFSPLLVAQALDTIAATVGLGSTEQAAHLQALWLFGQALSNHLVLTTPAGQATLNTAQQQEWHLLTPDAQVRQNWETWRRGGTFELLWLQERTDLRLQRAPFLAQQFTPLNLAQEIGQARRLVLRLLAMLELETWYGWETLTQYIHTVRPDFLHTHFDERFFWLATRDHFKYSFNNAKHWDTAYQAFLRAMFETGLYGFGAVELAREGTQLVAFQITHLGEWLIRNKGADAFPAPAPITFASDEPLITWLDPDSGAETFRIRGGPDSMALLTAARTIADPTPARLTFRISNDALARSMERNLTPDAIAQKFSEAGAPLPDTLRARLEGLYANYGRVHLYEQLTVLELGDDFVLRELLANTSLRQFILHQFSPRLVVMRDDAVEKFVQELEKKGYTPRVI